MHFLLISNILRSKNFILWVLFMATQQGNKATNYKRRCFLLLVIFLASIGWRWYLKASNLILEKSISSVNEKIQRQKSTLANFSNIPGYDKLQYVQDLESSNVSRLWSDRINKIMEIFGEILDVDKSDTRNIKFSDFRISLEEISLHGHVSSLRILYQWSSNNNKKPLIEMFEDLDFLDNISIQRYDKSSEERGYEFILTANVINNAK